MNNEHEYYREALSGLVPDLESVRRWAKQQRTARTGSRSQLRWAVPVLGVVCAAVICSFVPAVGASFVNFFHGDSGRSAATYVNTPAYERPEIEAVTVQRVEPASGRVREYADKDLSWAERIDSVKVEEALYDGGRGELTLKYVIDGSAFGLQGPTDLSDAMADGFVPEAGEKFPCVLEGQLVEDAGAIVDIENVTEAEYVAPLEVAHLPINTVADAAGGVIQMTSTYELPPDAAAGELTLLVPCAAASPAEDALGENYEHLGFLQIPFQITAAEAAAKKAPAETYMLNGKPFEVTEAIVSPTGLTIRFQVPDSVFPAETDFDFEIYADGRRLTVGEDGVRVSYLDYLMSDSVSAQWDGMIRIPFIGMDISRVTLAAVDRHTGEPLTDDQIELAFD